MYLNSTVQMKHEVLKNTSGVEKVIYSPVDLGNIFGQGKVYEQGKILRNMI